jgi:AcrR family transcriptional regulator
VASPLAARRAERLARLVTAARELMRESGTTEFTLPEVVSRARTSLRAFYEHFEKKDDLLVAVFKAAIMETAAGLEQATAGSDRPEERLELYVRRLFSGTFDEPHPETTAIISLQLRLAIEQPDVLADAFRPQHELLVTILRDGAARGEFRSDTSPGVLALLVSQLVVAAVQTRALAREALDGLVDVDDVVAFCVQAVRATSSRGSPTAPRQRRSKR